MVKRQMTLDDFKHQEKIIFSDGRYSFELKTWMMGQLIDTFREINHCLPHEYKNQRTQEESWRW